MMLKLLSYNIRFGGVGREDQLAAALAPWGFEQFEEKIAVGLVHGGKKSAGKSGVQRITRGIWRSRA